MKIGRLIIEKVPEAEQAARLRESARMVRKAHPVAAKRLDRQAEKLERKARG